MSLRLEMLQAARLAPTLLLEAGPRVIEFLQSRLHDDGGAKNRSGARDLYYTVFAIEGLMAMGVDPPAERMLPYLRGFNDGDGLDLVHQTCLARCWASMPKSSHDPDTHRRILENIESYRSADGGYCPTRGAETGTVYHAFLALGAYQDLDEALPDKDRVEHSLDSLQTQDGAYANERNLHKGTTTTTAAAATLLKQLGQPVPRALADWLLARCQDQGGFLATPDAPLPDLLSTATALHALAGMNVSLDAIRTPCLDFLDSLWTGRAFCGHWADDREDCEYTYYALLALGHLSG